jgi:uncharacterized lipoprotein YddW (UPF0748 family)
MEFFGVLTLFYFLLYFLEAEPKRIKSAWVDTSQCLNEDMTKKLIEVLHENGVNRVYVDAWQNGKVFYHSKTMTDAIGEKGIGQMIIPWFIKYAKKQHGMEVIGWFEFGYIASMYTLDIPFGLYALEKGWVLGECDDFYYMDPRSMATQFLVGILSDSLDEGLDGVQFDDHFACPSKFEQCSADVLLQAASYIKGELKAKHKFIFSLAPAPMPDAIRDYRVDWHTMMKKGYFDEIVPLLYTDSFNWFMTRLKYHEANFLKEYKDKAIIGIMANVDSTNLTKWSELEKMIRESNNLGYGVAIWYAKAVADDYKKEFHKLWKKTK